MVSLLRTLRLLSISIWFGGIVFFAFVLAPVAFGSLPSAHEAGIVVRGSILILHRIGFVCGALFVAATLFLIPRGHRNNLAAQSVLVVLMLGITLGSQLGIISVMERDRVQAGGTIETLAPEDPTRLQFEHLHAWSERLEGAVLVLGLGVLLLMAREEPEKL